ncbi:MAG: gas vesicle protein [Pseudonocardiaceae bacterium]
MSAALGPPGAPRLAVVDLLDRLLAGGVVLVGEITISVADVELVQISLRALIASVDACQGAQR